MLTFLLASAVLAPTLSGDFDHDGKQDIATVVQRGANYEVVLRRGSDPHHPLDLGSLGAANLDFFLERAKAGRFQTWCAKGAEDGPCPIQSVRLHGGELVFGVREATASVVIWSGKRFKVILLSD